MFRDDGRSDFEALLTRRGGESASLVAFDLISLEGEDQRLRLLEERREALSRLVAGLDRACSPLWRRGQAGRQAPKCRDQDLPCTSASRS